MSLTFLSLDIVTFLGFMYAAPARTRFTNNLVAFAQNEVVGTACEIIEFVYMLVVALK